MPQAYISRVANDCNVELKVIDKLWNEAKADANAKSIIKDSGNPYPLVTIIFQAKIKKYHPKCYKKLGLDKMESINNLIGKLDKFEARTKSLSVADLDGIIINWMENEYYDTDEGNSFFFNGGCYVFADSLYYFLKSKGLKSELLDNEDGDHKFIKYKNYYFDANGSHKSISDLINSADIQDVDYDFKKVGPYDKVNDEDVVYYVGKLNKYYNKEMK